MLKGSITSSHSCTAAPSRPHGVAQAISVALREHPGVNASLAANGEALVQHGDHNLGVAMDTPAGLVVPNVKRVQQRSIPDIAAELARLQVPPALSSIHCDVASHSLQALVFRCQELCILN